MLGDLAGRLTSLDTMNVNASVDEAVLVELGRDDRMIKQASLTVLDPGPGVFYTSMNERIGNGEKDRF